jgi:AcrR family transcriptional regulator
MPSDPTPNRVRRVTKTVRGRPRSETARVAVLEATRDLVIENGYEKLTMDAIAARSGVSKMTMYRWWPSKAAIVADAVLDGTIPIKPVRVSDTGDFEQDLATWIEAALEGIAVPDSSAMVLALAAATASDVRAGDDLYARFTSADRAAFLTRISAAITAGQFRDDVDPESFVDLLFGVILYYVLTRNAPDPSRAPDLAAIVVQGVRTLPA